MEPKTAHIWLDGWAGRCSYPVLVVGETPKRYRVQLTMHQPLPGRARVGNVGDVVLVPKYSVTFDKAAAQKGQP